MGDLSFCEHEEFAGPWHRATLTFHPVQQHLGQIEFEHAMRRKLMHFTASLLSPFFCLAVEEGVVWPQVILVLPMAKVWSKKIQCYVLQRVDPQLNDVDHTKVQMPAQHAFCSKSFEACNRRVQCSAQGKIHLQSIAIKNILACALYKSPAGKKLQSAFSKTPCGNFELNNTTQAVKIRESFHQHRKLYFDDYVLESTV